MNKHDDFNNGLGDELDRWLRDAHSEEPKPTPGMQDIQPDEKIDGVSPEFEAIRAEIEKIMEMCHKSGISVQIALSDKTSNRRGEPGKLYLCGHMTPNNIPCEMIAASAVYQSHHLFSHMVMAMAAAGDPIINPANYRDEGDEHGQSS